LAIALTRGACGGGGGGTRADPPPPGPPPTRPPPPPEPPVVEPPDPAYSRHLSLTGAGEAHAAGLTGAGLRIGVIDSGVNRDHPALAGRSEERRVGKECRSQWEWAQEKEKKKSI